MNHVLFQQRQSFQFQVAEVAADLRREALLQPHVGAVAQRPAMPLGLSLRLESQKTEPEGKKLKSFFQTSSLFSILDGKSKGAVLELNQLSCT